MKSRASLCAFGLMLSATAAHAQAVYKCVQADGRMTYQQEKCAETVKQSTVRPPDAPADKTSSERRADDHRKRREKIMNERLDGHCPSPRMVEIMGDLGLCSTLAQFQERHGQAVREWKVRNAEAYRACMRDEQALRRASDLATQTGARLRGNGRGHESHCEMFAATLRTDTATRAAKADDELAARRKAEKARFGRENHLIIIQTGEAAAGIPFCAGEVSGFEEKHRALIQDWRRLHPKVMDYYEQDEDGRFLMAGHQGAMRRRLEDDRSEIAAHCGSLVNVMRAQLAATSKK